MPWSRSIQAMTDDELRQQTAEFRERLSRGRDARRHSGRGVCRLPRGRPPVPRHAALRRAADRRHGAARAATSPKWSPAKARRSSPRCRPISTRSTRQGRPRRHGQRLPGPPRHGMDGPALHGPGPHRRRDPERHGIRRAAEGLCLRHHLRHEQRVRLRLPPRQHAARRPRRRPLSQAPAAVAGHAALRDHRRSRQHPHRRSPHAADHLRPGLRRCHASTPRPTRSPGS